MCGGGGHRGHLVPPPLSASYDGTMEGGAYKSEIMSLMAQHSMRQMTLSSTYGTCLGGPVLCENCHYSKYM